MDVGGAGNPVRVVEVYGFTIINVPSYSLSIKLPSFYDILPNKGAGISCRSPTIFFNKSIGPHGRWLGEQSPIQACQRSSIFMVSIRELISHVINNKLKIAWLRFSTEDGNPQVLDKVCGRVNIEQLNCVLFDV